jgi:hypothetical protein
LKLLWMGLFPVSFSDYSLLMYRKAVDFYMLILYPATFLKVFTGFRLFLVESLESFTYRIISSANKDYSSYFIFILCLITLARNSSNTLNKSRENGEPCLISDFGEIISDFPHLVWCWLLDCHIQPLLC